MTTCVQEIHVPRQTANDAVATVVALRYGNGDEVRAGDELLDLETSKTVFSITAESGGYVEYFCEPEQDVAVGAVVARVYSQKPGAASGAAGTQRLCGSASAVRFSPGALRRLGELGMDRSMFSQHDLVTVHDVNDRVVGLSVESADVRFEKLSRAKQTEISRLREVQSRGLTGSVTIKADVRGVLGRLNRHMTFFQDSLLPLVVYESSRLLRCYERLNAYLDDGRIALHNGVHVGIAIDIDDGLKVAKIVDADRLSFPGIEAEIRRLTGRYLDKTLTPSELSGATFTVTDLSAEGVYSFIPLIDAGQSAILAIAAVDPAEACCLLTLTFDHRVSEGRTAARFLAELSRRIESHRSTGASAPTDRAQTVRCARCLKTLAEDRSSRGPGMIRVLNHEANEVLLCRSCFDGW